MIHQWLWTEKNFPENRRNAEMTLGSAGLAACATVLHEQYCFCGLRHTIRARVCSLPRDASHVFRAYWQALEAAHKTARLVSRDCPPHNADRYSSEYCRLSPAD